jgi:hypothetical protein
LQLRKKGYKSTVHLTYKYAVKYNENYLFMDSVDETTVNIKRACLKFWNFGHNVNTISPFRIIYFPVIIHILVFYYPHSCVDHLQANFKNSQKMLHHIFNRWTSLSVCDVVPIAIYPIVFQVFSIFKDLQVQYKYHHTPENLHVTNWRNGNFYSSISLTLLLRYICPYVCLSILWSTTNTVHLSM